MMYCTKDDLINGKISEKQLINLTNDIPTGTSIDDSVLNSVIEEQSSVIDDYLRGRYQLPLKSTHKILQLVCSWLTIYSLYLRRGTVPESVKYQYEDSIRQLNNLQNGRIILDENNTSGEKRRSRIIVSNRDSVYTKVSMDNYGK